MVDRIQISFQPIDKNQSVGVGSLTDGCKTSDLNSRPAVQLTGIFRHQKPRNLTLQGLHRILDRNRLEGVRLDCSHSSGEINLLLRGESYNHSLIKRLTVFLKADVYLFHACGHRAGLNDIAHAIIFNLGAIRHREGIPSLLVRHCAYCRAFDVNRHSRQRQ